MTPTDPFKVVTDLNAALSKAQAAFPKIERTVTVEVQHTSGGRHSFKYAPLEVILAAVREALGANGLAITQLLEDSPSEGRSALCTELRHEGGGVISSSFSFKAPDSPQALGSMLTYLRRYAIVALLGLATEEDDDGQAAADANGGTTPTEGAVNPSMISDAQHRKIGALLKQLEDGKPVGEGELSWVGQLRERFKVKSRTELTKAQASEAIEWLGTKL